MAEVRLSKAAARDLSDIFFDSVEQFGRPAAEACRDSLKRSLALLAAHPLSARARPDLGVALRSRSHGPHMIFYEVRGDIVAGCARSPRGNGCRRTTRRPRRSG